MASPETGQGADERSDGQPADSREELESFLLACLGEPDRVKRQLPYVIRLLEAEDRVVRLCAAWACCLVALETDEAVATYLTRRLNDRVTAGEASPELMAAYEYLSAAFPDTAPRPVEEGSEERGLSAARGYYRQEPGGRTDRRDRSTARGGENSPPGTERPEPGAAGPSAGGAGGGSGSSPGESGRPETEEGDDGQAGGEETPKDGETNDDTETDPGGATDPDRDADTMRGRTRELSAIGARSRFDGLEVRGGRRRGRYATTYESLVGQGGGQRAVCLRVLRRVGTDGTTEFDAEVGRELERWEAVGDHDNVVTVLDWGTEPHPWLATAPTDGTLAGRGATDAARALEQARSLADAVAHLHQADVVHGGIDPKNVVYPSGAFVTPADGAPRLDNVGLIHAFRRYVSPASCLDPRYAAPEYYAAEFGRIDHATDIYQLGAVLYRLFAGRPPYVGEFTQVREAVTGSEPPPPSTVAEGVPAGVDDLVTKAMATRKLRRYETVEHLRAELAGLGDDHG